jgi:hypothetical protein
MTRTLDDSARKRDEWDRHNRDEAQARADQQAAAGPTHKPVPLEPYAAGGTQPAARDADLDAGALADEYERAAAAERQAWLAARNLIDDDGGGKLAWDEWRDAVERTQRAARRIVNYRTAREHPG